MVSAPTRSARALQELLDELGVVPVASLEHTLSYGAAAADRPDALDAIALFMGAARTELDGPSPHCRLDEMGRTPRSWEALRRLSTPVEFCGVEVVSVAPTTSCCLSLSR